MENKSLDRTKRASVIKEVKAKLKRSCRFEDEGEDTGNCWLSFFGQNSVIRSTIPLLAKKEYEGPWLLLT